MEDATIARLLTPEVEWILNELQDDSTTSQRRRDIGQRLAELGDPREGTGLAGDGLPDILWRAIPAGSVEIEGHGRFQVAEFHIDAYPITFLQFRAFLDAEDGFSNSKWWTDLQYKDTDPAWRDPLTNHPLTHVSWYDATAFCRWLSAKRKREIRLPDEHEWQWAAQNARTGYNFPWGPDWKEGFANTDESGIRRTTAVGMFPRGDSAQGVSDLAGNIWEWCRNEYQTPQKIGPVARSLACCAGALGAAVETSRARPAAAASILATATTMSAFGW